MKSKLIRNWQRFAQPTIQAEAVKKFLDTFTVAEIKIKKDEKPKEDE